MARKIRCALLAVACMIFASQSFVPATAQSDPSCQKRVVGAWRWIPKGYERDASDVEFLAGGSTRTTSIYGSPTTWTCNGNRYTLGTGVVLTMTPDGTRMTGTALAGIQITVVRKGAPVPAAGTASASAPSQADFCKCVGSLSDSCRSTRANISIDDTINVCGALILSGRYNGKDLTNILFSRAGAHRSNKQYDRAIADYSEAIELKPDDAGFYDHRGLTFFDMGQYDFAIEDFDTAIEIRREFDRSLGLDFGDHSVYLWNRGWAYAAKGEHDRAIQDYNNAFKGCGSCNFYNSRGESYAAKGQYDRAIQDYNKAIQAGGYDKLIALNNRAIAYRNKGEYDRSIKDIDEAIKLTLAGHKVPSLQTIPPKWARDTRLEFAKFHAERGKTLVKKGDHLAAIKDFDQAIRLVPDDLNAYYLRAGAHRAKGDLDRAIADYSEVIKLDPEDADPYNARGVLYAAKGDYDRAIADYGEAIKLDAKLAAAYFNRGEALRGKRDLDRAIADYNEAIGLNPKDAEAYRARGTAYSAKRDLDRALADLTKAIELAPKAALAYVTRGTAHAVKGERERAIADYSEAIKLTPSAESHTLRAWALFQTGKTDAALSDLNRAIQLDAKFAAAYATRAFIYETTKRKDEAIADYRQALALRPGNRDAADGLTRLGAAPTEAAPAKTSATEAAPKKAPTAEATTTVAQTPAPGAKNSASTPSTTADARRDYELAKDVGTKGAWQSFLAHHSTGFYADLARQQIAKLEAEEAKKAKPQSAPPDSKQAAPSPPKTNEAPKATGQSGGNRIVCGKSGCQELKPGCRAVQPVGVAHQQDFDVVCN